MTGTEKQEKVTVNIIIDRTHYKSPNPTTGAALYALGNVQAGYTLFQETPGPQDDVPIASDGTEVHLHDGTKFYSSQNVINPGAVAWP